MSAAGHNRLKGDASHSAGPLQPATLVDHLRKHLNPVHGASDNNDLGDLPPPVRDASATHASTTPAAVLVPLHDSEHGLELILTVRSDQLTRHPGQISFPGGREDPEDANPLATALRETHEEIGLAPERVLPIGSLSHYRTITGYRVVPVVGLVQRNSTLTREPSEVAEIFHLPLSHVLAPGAIVRESAHFRGKQHFYYVIDYQDYRIWGATAAMIRQLVQTIGPC